MPSDSESVTFRVSTLTTRCPEKNGRGRSAGEFLEVNTLNSAEALQPVAIWFPYLVALASILLSSAAQIFLKLLMRSESISPSLFGKPLFYAGFIAYGVSAILWLKVLSKLPLAVAYPLVSLNFFFVAIGASLFLHERITWQTAVGLVFIFSGIVIISRN